VSAEGATQNELRFQRWRFCAYNQIPGALPQARINPRRLALNTYEAVGFPWDHSVVPYSNKVSPAIQKIAAETATSTEESGRRKAQSRSGVFRNASFGDFGGLETAAP
jgi:hypothetical protein